MSDTNLLIKIATDLATNTEATKAIENHLAVLNGKVALNATQIEENRKDVSKLKVILMIIGAVVGTLAITRNPDFINFVLKII